MTLAAKEDVLEALKAVFDPEIGVDIVNLGLVYELEIEGGDVKVLMTLTSMGCPASGLIEFQAKEAAATVPGVEKVDVQFTFDPPWSPEKMTEEGKEMMQAMGFW